MAKMLGVQQIQMYENMIREEFDPLILILTARGDSVRDQIVHEVKEKLGLFKLWVQQTAIREKLNEITARINELTDKQYHDGTYLSRVEKEVAVRMEELNKPLKEAKGQLALLIKQIRLAGVAEDVKNIFTAVDQLVKDGMAEAKNLLPVKDMLKIQGPRKKKGPF